MTRMTWLALFFGLLLTSGISAYGATGALTVRADRADYLYSLGDTAVFNIEMPAIKAGSRLKYRFREEETRLVSEGVIDSPRESMALRGSLDRPGFLRLDLELVQGSDTLRAVTAAGFDARSILPSGAVPVDWRMFWQQGLGEIARIEPDPRVSRWSEQSEPGVTRYLVSLANIEGSRIFGWLSVPDGPGPFPAVVYIQGAPGGIEEFHTDPMTLYAKRGMIALAINPHGQELGREESFYRALLDRGIPGNAAAQGADDPYRFYFRRVVLGAVRAVDYLCSRPDVDTRRVAVAGASQGGGLSLLLAAVDRRIKAVTVHVPAMCDYSGALSGRASGWPWLIRESRLDPRVVRTAGYFDAALAAGMIHVPAFFTVSHLDRSCPPTTVYAAFNSLRGPKAIKDFPNTTHPASFTPQNDSLLVKRLEDIFRGMKDN